MKSLKAKLEKLEKRHPRIWHAYYDYMTKGWTQEQDENIPMRFIHFVDEAERAEDYVRQIANILAQKDGFNSADDIGCDIQDWLTVGEASTW
tara:strand:+ start:471 stop:746 length:276 start_codon:yes stop_codon:yes gene_type:complete